VDSGFFKTLSGEKMMAAGASTPTGDGVSDPLKSGLKLLNSTPAAVWVSKSGRAGRAGLISGVVGAMSRPGVSSVDLGRLLWHLAFLFASFFSIGLGRREGASASRDSSPGV
jgi:hypothetical protein